MKQTSFFWQVLIGLRQEFQALIHNPSKPLLFYSTVIIFTFMNIWNYKQIEGNPESKSGTKTILNTKDLTLLPLFYLGPEIVLSQKFVQEQKFKIKDFLITNGMKASAYTTKILFACYFLLVPATLANVMEAYYLNSFHSDHEAQKMFLFGIFLNHFTAGFAIVNLNFLVSKILSEKYIIPFILLRALLPFFSLVLGDILSSIDDISDSIFDVLETIIQFLNPATPLTTNITALSKQVFCIRACVHYKSINITNPHNYTDFPQCMELFNGNITKEIDGYCHSEKDFEWLSHLKAAFIVGLIYLIFIFLLNLVNKLNAWRAKRQKKTHKGGQELLLQDHYDSMEHHLSLDMSQDLAKGRRQTILRDSNIKVRKEEILCILGDNESGQTTLARILAGLSSNMNGPIIFNDREYNLAEIDSLIGYCSQKDFPLIDNTIDENLKFFSQLRGANQDLEPIKNKAGLKEYSGSLLVSKLSTDQRMMLNMANVLLGDPQIIILDDPTAELDSSSKMTFRKLLKHWRAYKEKKTIVYTAQSVKDAELADRVALLEKDGSSTSGTLDEIKENKLEGQYTLIISIRGEKNAPRIETKQKVQNIIKDHLIGQILLDDTIDSILKYRVPFTENTKKLRGLFEKLAKISDIEVNFKGLSLDEYLEKRQESESRSSSLPEKIKITPASNQYNLTTQIRAIFLKRLYTWKRRRALLVLFVFLASFIFGLLFIAKHCLLQDSSMTFTFVLFSLLISVVICSSIKMIFTGSELISNHQSYQIHTLNIMGLNPWAYWLGNLLADLFSQAPFILFTLILVQFIDAKSIYERVLLAVSTINLYANIIVYAYSLTVNKWVKNLQSILLMTFFAFFISVGTSGMTTFLLKLIGVTQQIPSLLVCTFSELILSSIIILYSLPPFQIVMGYHIMSGIVGKIFDKFQDPSKTSWPPLNQLILILITWLSIFMPLLCLVLKNSADFKKYKIKTENSTIINEQSPDRLSDQPKNKWKEMIIDEQKRVQKPDNTDFLKFLAIDKKEDVISDSKVSDLTFGVRKGSIFALVGNNRGGKNEVLDLYGQHTFVSSGKILLQGQDLPCPPYKSSLVKIGFCLSTNAFWEDLSPIEHLEIYALIKGIPKSMISEAIQEIITGLDLSQYAGTPLKDIKEEAVKRKLSVGLAVLGAPDLIILDEPTKGMDPTGRNQVWKILKELVSKESTILMATNQMEDAELKADRTGIMVDGRLVKIDPVDRIEQNKTDYYYLKFEGIKKEDQDNLKQKIESLEFKFHRESSQEAQEGKVTFYISKQIAKSKFSKVFKVLEEELDDGEIRDFSFAEKSLNEVFEDLVKNKK